MNITYIKKCKPKNMVELLSLSALKLLKPVAKFLWDFKAFGLTILSSRTFGLTSSKSSIFKRASWVLLGAPVVKCRQRLLCPQGPYLVRFIYFGNWSGFCKWKQSQALTQGNSLFSVNDLHSWTHSSSLLGSLIN